MDLHPYKFLLTLGIEQGVLRRFDVHAVHGVWDVDQHPLCLLLGHTGLSDKARPTSATTG